MKRGIFLLLVIFIAGCTASTQDNNTNVPTPAETKECITDSDCVPSSCCHASSCISKDKAPNCSDYFCTLDCAPNTLDCNQGSCSCINNKCQTIFN